MNTITSILANTLSVNILIAWYALAAVGLTAVSLFSGLETGIYRLNPIRLHLLAQQPKSQAATLARLLKNPNQLLSTLLIGNNIANYLASYAIAVLLLAAGYNDWQQILINAAILIPLLFLFGEVLPKDLFANYTDTLTYPFARSLSIFQRILTYTGLLPIINLTGKCLMKLSGNAQLTSATLHPRRQITQLIQEGAGQGLISPYQSDIIDRVLHPTETKVSDAMIRWADVVKLRVTQPPEAVWAICQRTAFSRFPVIDQTGKPIGLLDAHDVLLKDPDTCPPIKTLTKNKLPHLPSDMSLPNALLELQHHKCQMGIVIKNNRPIGIVTFKDLVEPIVGELETW